MKSDEFYKTWLKATIIRCARTFAFSVVGLLPTSTVLNDIDFGFIFTSSLLSTLACFFTCITGIPETEAERELKSVMNESNQTNIENLEVI